MKMSVIYRFPIIYKLLMKFLYGKNYRARYQSIAAEIPAAATVLDVCCGDCGLYNYALRNQPVAYSGVDINPIFISAAKKQGIRAECADIEKDQLPRADYVVLQGSLYQFIPKQKQVVDKLLKSANKKVIICEPVINMSDSKNPLIAFIGQRAANPGTGDKMQRFNEATLRDFCAKNYSGIIEKIKFIPGGREMIIILDASSA